MEGKGEYYFIDEKEVFKHSGQMALDKLTHPDAIDAD